MGLLRRVADRLERVLALAEPILADLRGADPGPAALAEARAFRWREGGGRGPGRLMPIEAPARFELEDLLGVDSAVEALVRNVEQLVCGLPFNHVLLYGERGTGKSSSVKGVLERFAPRGLRLVELHKSELPDLPRVLDAIRRASGGRAGGDYRFLVFVDDLSFDIGEAGYRELKAALEGSFEAPPENVCIVVTSNRRHLLPESMADNRAARVDEHGDLHVGEALDEKLALSDRFGLRLGFYAFDQKKYLAIVEHYVKKAGLELPADEVREWALRWALHRASRTGRSAKQFVDDLVGRTALRQQKDRGGT